MSDDDLRAKSIEANDLADTIRPLLAGRDPGVQGAALADLLAMWLAGHPPFIRDEMLEMHIEIVRELVVVNEKIMFGEAGHPQNEAKGTPQ